MAMSPGKSRNSPVSHAAEKTMIRVRALGSI
jgi:hypothetical protein